MSALNVTDFIFERDRYVTVITNRIVLSFQLLISSVPKPIGRRLAAFRS